MIDTAQNWRQALDSTAWKTLKVAEKDPLTGLIDVQPGSLTTANRVSAFTNTWLRQN